MKRYIVKIHERAPKGKFLRFEHVEAENKRQFLEKAKTWNENHPNEWIVTKTAFVLTDT